jgi:hypothetical protein
MIYYSHSFSQQFSEAIEDNSFFIEEAYNQEDRVVQHIFNGVYSGKPAKDINLSFTQEWPVGGYKNQLSYTIPFSFLNSNSVSGINDILINYRYQLFYKEDWACVAPRISLIIPTGDPGKGLGSDVFGLQTAIPVSKRISNEFVVHANAGITYLPGVKQVLVNGNEVKNNMITYTAGGSIIWLVIQDLNFMLEYLYTNSPEVNEKGMLSHVSGNLISPGIRYAININNLQIVPGIAVPITFKEGSSQTGLFLYLSFEHPF